MTTRYHSISGVLSLNIQLTRSAGANNSPLQQPIISPNHQNNRQKLLFHLIRITVVALHHSSDLVSKFSQSTMFELVPRLWSYVCSLDYSCRRLSAQFLLLYSSAVQLYRLSCWMLCISNLLFTHNQTFLLTQCLKLTLTRENLSTQI